MDSYCPLSTTRIHATFSYRYRSPQELDEIAMMRNNIWCPRLWHRVPRQMLLHMIEGIYCKNCHKYHCIGGLVVKLAVAIRGHTSIIRPAPGSIPGRCITHHASLRESSPFCFCYTTFVFMTVAASVVFCRRWAVIRRRRPRLTQFQERLVQRFAATIDQSRHCSLIKVFSGETWLMLRNSQLLVI
jgi:hypothetical protein